MIHSISKVYLTTIEVCRKCNIPESKLRYWQSQGVVKPDKENPTKYRTNTVKKIKRVVKAAETGKFTLKGLKDIFYQRDLRMYLNFLKWMGQNIDIAPHFYSNKIEEYFNERF